MNDRTRRYGLFPQALVAKLPATSAADINDGIRWAPFRTCTILLLYVLPGPNTYILPKIPLTSHHNGKTHKHLPLL